MSSCFSRCLRVPIAIRAFYESYLWILQTLLLTHPDLHPGLLGIEEARNGACPCGQNVLSTFAQCAVPSAVDQFLTDSS